MLYPRDRKPTQIHVRAGNAFRCFPRTYLHRSVLFSPEPCLELGVKAAPDCAGTKLGQKPRSKVLPLGKPNKGYQDVFGRGIGRFGIGPVYALALSGQVVHIIFILFLYCFQAILMIQFFFLGKILNSAVSLSCRFHVRFN